jgi:hypothetical protein
MLSFTLEFEEKCVLERNGVSVLHAGGHILAYYDESGDWYIDQITLDGTRRAGDSRWLYEHASQCFTRDDKDPWFALLAAGLSKSMSDEICEEVALRLIDDGEPLRRLSEHTTRWHSMQGTSAA